MQTKTKRHNVISVCRAAKKSSSLRRSKSASNLSLSASSLLNKSSIREARPIENSKLRKTLSKSQDLSNITATPRVCEEFHKTSWIILVVMIGLTLMLYEICCLYHNITCVKIRASISRNFMSNLLQNINDFWDFEYFIHFRLLMRSLGENLIHWCFIPP